MLHGEQPASSTDRPVARASDGRGRDEMPVAVERRQVTVQGHEVTYKVAGAEAGEPVVLVHGLAGSTRWWTSTIPALAPHYRVYLVDLPGFGGMRRFPGGFVLEQAASWLVAWMHALDLRSAHLVGHSMGGYICLKVAAQHPEITGCLVLISPAGVPSGRATLDHLWPLVQESVLSTSGPMLLTVLLRDALRAGPRTLWRASMDLLVQDVREELHRVCGPTLLVWGEKDSLVPLALAYVLRREIAHASLFVMKGARHVPMFDNPQQLNRVLLTYLSGHPIGE